LFKHHENHLLISLPISLLTANTFIFLYFLQFIF
jgi:hypothetical protein